MLRFWSITPDSHCLLLVKEPCLRIKCTEQKDITRLSLFRQLKSTCIASLVFSTFYIDCKASVPPFKGIVHASAFLKFGFAFWIRLTIQCVMFLSVFKVHQVLWTLQHLISCLLTLHLSHWMKVHISVGQYKILVLNLNL